MKKWIGYLVLLSVLFVLAACGDKDQVENGKDVTYNHSFAEFNLDVAYTPTEKYEASFEKSVDGLEVQIEDERNKIKINGNEAFDKLNPLLEKLTFDASTSNEEVINEVISVFGLDNNFAEFELEVLFQDGTAKEYRLIK